MKNKPIIRAYEFNFNNAVRYMITEQWGDKVYTYSTLDGSGECSLRSWIKFKNEVHLMPISLDLMFRGIHFYDNKPVPSYDVDTYAKCKELQKLDNTLKVIYPNGYYEYEGLGCGITCQDNLWYGE